MRRRTLGWLLALLLVLAAALAAQNPASAALTDGIPARIVVIRPPISEATYSGVDYGHAPTSGDDRQMLTTWRVVENTGNCCENYITTTPGGRLLDFGGKYINFSDDRGQTWRQVQPLAPLVNGEGAIVAAPGGDVLGVEWDPYTGDHLQFYKFEADTQQWLYTEMPLHTPFYDREWITVVPGPVTIEGQSYEYVSFVKGGWPSKEVWFYSTDGLNYLEVTSKRLEQLLGGRLVQGSLPTTADSDNDWVQANTNGAMTSLGGGSLLAAPDYPGLVSDWALLEGQSFSWSGFRFADGSRPAGLFQVDSAGRIHNVQPAGAAFSYRISQDGGASWQATEIALPTGYTIEEIDFRANRAAGVGAVALRAQHADPDADPVPDTDQDFVFKLDITGSTPVLKRMYRVGLGDLNATGGVGNPVRFDFQTISIFPDGRVAVSFLDSTTSIPATTGGERPAPALAIELNTALGEKLK